MNTLVTVASLASTTAIASPAMVPASLPDPIFEMIERHRAAAAFYTTTNPDTDADEDDAAEAADCAALCQLLSTAPTTLAGCAAVLRYFADHLDEEDGPLGQWVEPFRTAGAKFMPSIAGVLESLLKQHASVLGALAVKHSAMEDSTDSELLLLEKKLKAANRRLAKADKVQDMAYENIKHENTLLPALPEEPQPPAEFAELWTKAPSSEFKRLPVDHPIVVWERETREQRATARQMKYRRGDELSKQCGYDVAHQRWENILQKEMWPIARKIWAIPARTAEGMRIKLDAMRLVGVDDEMENRELWWRSIRKDIRTMARVRSA